MSRSYVARRYLLAPTLTPCKHYSLSPPICFGLQATARSSDLSPPWLLLVGAHEGHGLPAEIAGKRRNVAVNHGDIRGNGKTIRQVGNSLRDAHHCASRTVGVILNSNQCNTTENLRSLVLSKQTRFFFSCYDITTFTNTTKSVK